MPTLTRAAGFSLALLASSCCLPCLFKRQKPTPPPPSATYDVIGVRKGLRGFIVAYSESLCRGGEVTGTKGIAELKALGIKTVVSVCPSGRLRGLCTREGLQLVEIPFGVSGPAEHERELFLKSMRESPKPVYLHCKTGTRRAGTLAMLYRMKMGGWSFESALLEFLRLGGDEKRDADLISSVKPQQAVE